MHNLFCRIISWTAALLLTSVTVHAQQEIAIGLLVQDSASHAVIKSARMAVEKANDGQDERKYSLEVRSMEGPWGTGSGKAVDLVFDENVCAVIASTDGRNSHLAEQVSAKTQVPFISAWSGDPTLAQAFIPWYYCVVPNYNQQAETILRQISSKPGKTVVLSAADYDSQLAAKSFTKIASKHKYSCIMLNESELNDLSKVKPQNIILFFPSEKVKSIFTKVREQYNRAFIFISLSFSYNEELTPSDITFYDGAYLVSPGFLFTEEGQNFRHEFMKNYNYPPGNAAAFIYDAMNLVIEATAKTVDRTELRQVLSSLTFNGITGTISFDKYGNRNGYPELMISEKGRFMKLN